MTPSDLDAYLHLHIPLSRHMGMRVLMAEPDRLRMHLPLQPNVNPHGTVFGGALSAFGLVCGWTLIHAAFAKAGVAVKLVAQHSQSDFLTPADADCMAESVCSTTAIDRLLFSVRERGRGRLSLDTVIRAGQQDVARHSGVYVALQEPHSG